MLIPPTRPRELGAEEIAAHYAAPRLPWLRVNMISTLDGAAQGVDGRSGGINNAVDKVVFDALRDLSDAVVVGAGTVRAEEYGPIDKPIVVVSRSGELPPSLAGADPGLVLMATCVDSPGLAAARERLGADHVIAVGAHDEGVDLFALKAALVDRGLRDLLGEGGPHLLRDLLDQGVADEITATIVPRVLAGDLVRMTAGGLIDVDLDLVGLLEHEGTLLGRWQVTKR